MRPDAATSVKPRPQIDARAVLAYHESGHAVLSAAINAVPHQLTLVGDATTHARTVQPMVAPPLALAQIYLAGFAAEHVLTGRRSRQFEQELRFALLARRDPELLAAFAGAEERDTQRAIRELLRTMMAGHDDEIRARIEELYGAARDSLAAVWPTVKRVAEALSVVGTLDRERIVELLGAGW